MLRHEVAAANNLPPCWPARLQGATREEMEADAKALADLLPAANTRRPHKGSASDRARDAAGRHIAMHIHDEAVIDAPRNHNVTV